MVDRSDAARTNLDLPATDVAIAYKQIWQVGRWSFWASNSSGWNSHATRRCAAAVLQMHREGGAAGAKASE